MSKYPFVLFYSDDSEIISFFKENSDKLNCTLFFTNEISKLNNLFNSNYQILITYGPDEPIEVNSIIANRMRSRWIHFKEIESIERFNNAVNYCFIHNCTLSRIYIRPIFSIFTTTFNSYNKIHRAYESIKKQTFIDYEWVILDDSSDDLHFSFLKELLDSDNKVRLYKRSSNSGNIGNVKNEVVSLCRGKYIIELDHDDEILPDVLKDSVECFESDDEIGFIYMDFINIHENGNNFHYGDFICKGYGSYYSQKYNNKWVYVYNTPNINNITLSHLVCCPNHPRIWKRSVLLDSGNYSEFLPICDDYEILLRTFCTTKMAKIHKLGYIQYMNELNNNFSLIRNSEINRIGPEFIQPIFYDLFKIDERCKELNCYEDPKYIDYHSKIWSRKDYTHLMGNKIVNLNYNKQYCIIGIQSLINKMEYIKELCLNPRNDFILLDSVPIEEIQKVLDSYNLDNFKCYSVPKEESINYFLMMYKSTENYEIINSEEYYLCVCCLIKNEAKYIEEWIEHYISQGVDHIYLVNNNSTDDLFKKIEKFTDLVTIINDNENFDIYNNPDKQKNILNRNFHTVINSSKWCIIVDIDEFIFGNNGDTIASYLNTIGDNIGCIYVIWKLYFDLYGNHSKVKNIKTRLNIDLYSDYDEHIKHFMKFGKSIFRTKYLDSPLWIHKVHTNKDIITNFLKTTTYVYDNDVNDFNEINEKSMSSVPLFLNHYIVRNKDEYDKKSLCNNNISRFNFFKALKELSPDNILLEFNTKLFERYLVINENTNPDQKYLEIGIEYGYNFNNVHFQNKIGVDPDPKFENESLIKLTSDDFFETNCDFFDTVFIDGMHQTEYVLRDFNNSISKLNNNGIIFIDDILPLNYNEQLKIPNKHIYENGILKYLEPWTGDVWKVAYYLLKYHSTEFEFKYYNNENYRGVGIFKILNKFNIPESSIHEINDFDYYKDFGEYLNVLDCKNI
jgi:glycosyltransferase involved in cell wall biosynthesis